MDPARLVIRTERLTLRPLGPGDAESLFALNADPAVIRYTGDPPFDSVDEAASLIRSFGSYEKYGMGRLAVTLRDTGVFIGWCGLKFHPESGMVDLGFRLHRRFWGYGYATEAAAACLRFGFETLEVKRITGRTVAANRASIRVLERLGMKPVPGKFDFHGMPGRVFVLDRADYIQKNSPAQHPDRRQGDGGGKSP